MWHLKYIKGRKIEKNYLFEPNKQCHKKQQSDLGAEFMLQKKLTCARRILVWCHLTFSFFNPCAFLWWASFLREFSVFSKAADGVLQVGECRQNMQVPWGRQTLSFKPLQNPPVCGGPRGTDAAPASDGEGQETVREKLVVRDPAGLAVGELLPLTNGTVSCHDVMHKSHIAVFL